MPAAHAHVSSPVRQLAYAALLLQCMLQSAADTSSAHFNASDTCWPTLCCTFCLQASPACVILSMCLMRSKMRRVVCANADDSSARAVATVSAFTLTCSSLTCSSLTCHGCSSSPTYSYICSQKHRLRPESRLVTWAAGGVHVLHHCSGRAAADVA